MRGFFDSLEDVELVTQCRYQAPKMLQEAIETAQRVKDCRLAIEASARPAPLGTAHLGGTRSTVRADDVVHPGRLLPGMPRGSRGTGRPRIHASSVRGCRL